MKIIKEILFDAAFIKKMLSVAVPISAQFFVTSVLNMIDVIMIGQSGEVPVTSVGIANQVYFVFSVFIFGISAGTAIFSAQYWGKKDYRNIQVTMGSGISMNAIIALLFTSAALFLPAVLMSLYTKDTAVIQLGSQYLRIVAVSCIFTAVTASFSAVLRSTEKLILPTTASIIAIALNTCLNYLLIFGKFGFPEMGVRGAAYATLIARIIECMIIMVFIYIKKYDYVHPKRDMFRFTFVFVKRYLHVVLPSLMTEAAWAVCVTIYMSIYARISTDAAAAVNIAATIEMFAFVFFIGIGHGSGILIGNSIGSGDRAMIKKLTGSSMFIVIFFSVIVSALIMSASYSVTGFYKIKPETAVYLKNILIVLGLFFSVKTSNMLFVDGILRSGGDTGFTFFLNFIPMYLIGIPAGLIGAFVLNLPVYYVYALVCVEEIVRFAAGYLRIRSGRWINNLSV
ncbi:MAG: MATE family efflux transporter [Spirochaetes bacterium]|nr:MATE family efflux transporter [Spirochaetota bacterium]